MLSHIHSTFFFFNDTATTEIYTLSLHDALPIFAFIIGFPLVRSAISGDLTAEATSDALGAQGATLSPTLTERSEEHTSELQSRQYLVCRLLLEKKKTHILRKTHTIQQQTYTYRL